MYKIYIKKNSDTKTFLEEVLKIYGYSKKDIVYNEYRKPFIKDNELYFSVSHDRNLIVIVVSDKCIGVDLQFLTYDEKVLKKAYTEKEIEILKQSNNRLYDFTKMWTMKEAYVKFLGKGLTYDFKRIETPNIINEYEFIENNDYIIAIYSK